MSCSLQEAVLAAGDSTLHASIFDRYMENLPTFSLFLLLNITSKLGSYVSDLKPQLLIMKNFYSGKKRKKHGVIR